MERMLSETEARHYLNHHAPNRAMLPPPDRSTNGRDKWYVSTIVKLAPDPRVNWNLAKCVGQQTLFFSELPASVARAKAICASCPVRQSCCRVVLSMPVRQSAYGVWAGTSAEERKAWRHQKSP